FLVDLDEHDLVAFDDFLDFVTALDGGAENRRFLDRIVVIQRIDARFGVLFFDFFGLGGGRVVCGFRRFGGFYRLGAFGRSLRFGCLCLAVRRVVFVFPVVFVFVVDQDFLFNLGSDGARMLRGIAVLVILVVFVVLFRVVEIVFVVIILTQTGQFSLVLLILFRGLRGGDGAFFG